MDECIICDKRGNTKEGHFRTMPQKELKGKTWSNVRKKKKMERIFSGRWTTYRPWYTRHPVASSLFWSLFFLCLSSSYLSACFLTESSTGLPKTSADRTMQDLRHGDNYKWSTTRGCCCCCCRFARCCRWCWLVVWLDGVTEVVKTLKLFSKIIISPPIDGLRRLNQNENLSKYSPKFFFLVSFWYTYLRSLISS